MLTFETCQNSKQASIAPKKLTRFFKIDRFNTNKKIKKTNKSAYKKNRMDIFIQLQTYTLNSICENFTDGNKKTNMQLLKYT